MRSIATLAFVIAGCGSSAPPTSDPPRPRGEATVYLNAVVRTLDPARSTARGLRIEGDRITHVFDDEPAGLDGRRVDLGGAVVLPGLADAHLHLRGIGSTANELDLRGTTSAAEIAARVREAASSRPPGSWIRGRGWDQNDWAEQVYPTHQLLDDAAPEHPVYLTRIDGHAVWVSSRAVDFEVLSTIANPPGGEVVRGPDGGPTGVFVDNAIDLLDTMIPRPSREEIRADLVEGMARCARVGLTAVHDMGTTADVLAVLRELDERGELTLRVFAYLAYDPALIATQLGIPPDREGLLQVVGVKLFADGALGSRGALLLAPYADRPDSSGLAVTERSELIARARAIHGAGYQLAIHAIGDRGNRNALDAIEQAQGTERGRRHRIEHAQVVSPADIPRFTALGVVASMQPTHATSDMPWAEARVGPERLRGAYAWRTLIDGGAVVAFGSDAPVEGESPWLGIYAAVTRQDAAGSPPGGWTPAERVHVTEAIERFSLVPARVVGAEARGIAPGAPADLTIVDHDPLGVPPSELDDVRTLRTVVAGREVFVAP